MLEFRAAALPLLLLIFVVLYADASSNQNRLTIPSCVSPQTSKIVRLPFVLTRGGSISDSDDDEVDLDEEGEEEDDDDDDDDEEEIEDEVAELDPVMVKAAKKASHKSKEKLTAAVKAKVSAKLAAPALKTKKSGGLFTSIPYIIRASLNPFTLIAMTKAYFESLFNLNYLQEDKSQGLRSALEEKAKHAGSGGLRKGKRQMKPGQAKTLNDLPQLST